MNANKVVPASSVTGDAVVNSSGEHLGRIEDLVLDLSSGRVAYAVLSFGGFLGLGDKLFAVPWGAMRLDADHKLFLLDLSRQDLEEADGFDKDDWPDLADPELARRLHARYESRLARS
jgi:sporulation protein YlmC with PRC-barrel domain